MNFKITNKEWIFIAIIGILGFFFSRAEWIQYMNQQTPLKNFLIYYGIVYSALFILSKLGLVIWKISIKHPLQVLGAGLILFSFFLIFNWENPYVQYASTGSFEGASNVFYGTEDAITWNFWYDMTKEIESARILTFIVTPMALSLLGALFVSQIKFS